MSVETPPKPSDDWREQYLMAGVRVILKRALKEVGGYWTNSDTTATLIEQARRKVAPVEEAVDQWAALALNGTMPTDDVVQPRRRITKQEGEMMNAQARRTLELYRGAT